MRIYISTTPNIDIVPFNYQTVMVGAFHKWLGANKEHDQISLYSLSWLYRGKGGKKGLIFPEGSNFFISSPNHSLIERVIKGIMKAPEINYGMRVTDIGLQSTPDFGSQYKFFLQSPVLIKRNLDGRSRFFFPGDSESDFLLTETMKNKLNRVGFGDMSINIRFDRSYPNAKTKLVTYNGIHNKATFCPVIVEGDPAAVAFAWDVGVGNSTGIGFGAVI